jgi:hypothetical protein
MDSDTKTVLGFVGIFIVVFVVLLIGGYKLWQHDTVEYCKQIGYSGAWTSISGAWACK